MFVSIATSLQLLFVVYMIIVAILLVNMLIAMMGNTYQKIAETRNEWQRQWARIVLVVERGVPPAQRLKNLLAYSQPMASGKRALVLRINQKVISVSRPLRTMVLLKLENKKGFACFN